MNRLTAAVLLAATYVYPTLAADDKLEHRQDELRDVQQRIHSLEQDIHEKRGEYRKRFLDVQASEQAGAKTVAEIKKTKATLEQKIVKTNKLDENIIQLEQELTADRNLLSSLIHSAYLSSGDWLKFLLSRRDVARTGRMLAYYDYFNNLRLDRIDTVTTSLQKLNDMRQTIRQDMERLHSLEQRYLQLLDRYLKQRDQRNEAIGKLQEHLSGQDMQLALLKAQAIGLRELITRLEQKSRAPRTGQASFRSLKGRLNWPVSGSFANRFGGPRQGGLLTWDGIHIATSAGAPVHAISEGRVVYSDWFHDLGLLVILDHGEGYMSLYGHNEQLESRKGQRVDAGEVIAYVGDSGGRDESGVYFEVRYNGVPQDPTRWCQGSPDA